MSRIPTGRTPVQPPIAGNALAWASYPTWKTASQMTTKRLLTEAELLKMSEKEYMNEDQLAFFRSKLETLQAEILHNAGQTTENLRETVVVPDPADRATI